MLIVDFVGVVRGFRGLITAELLRHDSRANFQ